MVLPASMVELYNRKLGFYACTVSAIDQLALAHFMETGACERHINRARAHYRKLRDTLIDALKGSTLGSRIDFSEVDSGIHFGLDIQAHQSAREACRRLREQGVLISAMDDYLLQDHISAPREDAEVVRLLMNYASLELDQIPQVVSAFEVSLG